MKIIIPQLAFSANTSPKDENRLRYEWPNIQIKPMKTWRRYNTTLGSHGELITRGIETRRPIVYSIL